MLVDFRLFPGIILGFCYLPYVWSRNLF